MYAQLNTDVAPRIMHKKWSKMLSFVTVLKFVGYLKLQAKFLSSA